MSSSSRPAFAGGMALALLFSTSAIAGGARHGGGHVMRSAPAVHAAPARQQAPPRLAPAPVAQRVMHRPAAVMHRVVHQPAPAMHRAHPHLGGRPALVGPPVRAAPPPLPWGVHPRAYPVAQPHGFVAQPQVHSGPRVIDVPGRQHGRYHRRHGRGFAVVGAGVAAGYASAPTYAAAPYYGSAPQPVVEYLPLERPLTAVYGEPQAVRTAAACSQPAVHHIGHPVSHGPLPQVIYGLQPPCGPAHPATEPAEYSRSPVRAAY